MGARRASRRRRPRWRYNPKAMKHRGTNPPPPPARLPPSPPRTKQWHPPQRRRTPEPKQQRRPPQRRRANVPPRCAFPGTGHGGSASHKTRTAATLAALSAACLWTRATRCLLADTCYPRVEDTAPPTTPPHTNLYIWGTLHSTQHMRRVMRYRPYGFVWCHVAPCGSMGLHGAPCGSMWLYTN